MKLFYYQINVTWKSYHDVFFDVLLAKDEKEAKELAYRIGMGIDMDRHGLPDSVVVARVQKLDTGPESVADMIQTSLEGGKNV